MSELSKTKVLKDVLKRIQNCLVIIRRKKQYQIIRCCAFQKQGAAQTMAFKDNKLHINVQQYFISVHSKTLMYPNLPLLIEKPSMATKHENYYPLELLEIIPTIVYDNSQ